MRERGWQENAVAYLVAEATHSSSNRLLLNNQTVRRKRCAISILFIIKDRRNP